MMWVRAVTAYIQQISASVLRFMHGSIVLLVCGRFYISTLSKASPEMLNLPVTVHCGVQHACFATASLVQAE